MRDDAVLRRALPLGRGLGRYTIMCSLMCSLCLHVLGHSTRNQEVARSTSDYSTYT